MDTIIIEQISIWPFLAGPVASILVGLLVKVKAASWIKALLNLLISALSGTFLFIADLPAGTAIHWESVVASAMITWITSISVYEGFWKKNGTSDAINKATGNIGIG